MKQINYKKYPVPRLRHHVNPGLYYPLKSHKVKQSYYPPLIEKINWKDIFYNGKPPNYLDIGCGLGKFLIETAVSNPKANILGFEIRKGAVNWISSVIEGENIPNAKALWYSVVNGLPFIDDCSIIKIFYLFSDPWIKRRHHKRRAFSEELLSEFHRVLKPKGKIYIMTDVDEVDDYQRMIIERNNGFSFKYKSNDNWGINIKTNQQEFCLSKNIPFKQAVCEKI